MKEKKESIIMKFGGTSVSTKENIQTICAIVRLEQQRNPVIVVSALSGITDMLLSLQTLPKTAAKKQLSVIRKKHAFLIETIWEDVSSQEKMLFYLDTKLSEIEQFLKKRLNKALTDSILSYGEILSSYIIANALEKEGIAARPILATTLIVTDTNFGSAEFIVEQTKKRVQSILLPVLSENVAPVVTGFIGATEKGKTTTLGRGGSDYTASILGFCLNATEIQIWTDVDGIFTADPRLVKKARHLAKVSYKEASEMAFFGAKVLHPRTIRPAISAHIPVRILNTKNPTHKGTVIDDYVAGDHKITAISYKKNITLVNIYSTEMFLTKGFFVKIFEIFARHNISIDLVSVSEVSLSVTLDNDDDLLEAVKELSIFTTVTVTKNMAIVSMIGEYIAQSSSILKRIFIVLEEKNVNVTMISFGATNINISFVIEAVYLDETVKILHNRVLLKGLKV